MSLGNSENPYGYSSPGGGGGESVNPFAPTAHVEETIASPVADVHRYREYHIAHEASVKSIGVLYYLGAIVLIPVGIASVAGAFSPGADDAILMGIVGAVCLGFGALWIWLARGLRGLRPTARIVACIVSGFGLLSIPFGTIINGYILYLLLSQKGQAIFEPSYQRVIEETPDVKYRTSLIVIVLLVLLVLFVIGSMVAVVFVG